MSSLAQKANTPSSAMVRQFWSQHNYDNLERLRMLDPYAEARNIPEERLENSIPIQGTATNVKPSPVALLHLLREGTISQVAKALHEYLSAGGNINERMMDDQICPGVRELDTFLHVALRHRKGDVARYLMTNGSDASIQNWHLETPRSVAADVGLDDVIASMGQQGTNTTWAGASWENFRPKTQVAPQRSVVESHYAWREGAPKTTPSTKATLSYYPGSTAISTRQPVAAPLPHQREIGPAAAVPGRPGARPHHHAKSSPMSHIVGSSDGTRHHLSLGHRRTAYGGNSAVPSVAGARLAGARNAPTAVTYHDSGSAN